MLQHTSNSMFIANNISHSGTGISLLDASNNTIYQNNFIGNTKQIGAGPEPNWSGGNDITYSTCQWDNGKEGNYWSNYSGTDADGDGIGDTPHVINEKNADNFPLLNPVLIQETEITLPSPAPTETATPSPSLSPTPTTTPPNSELFPTSQVVAISASATVAAIGFLFYFKKTKH